MKETEVGMQIQAAKRKKSKLFSISTLAPLNTHVAPAAGAAAGPAAMQVVLEMLFWSYASQKKKRYCF